MTERILSTALDADAAARVTSLRAPMTHDEMAAAVARRGSLFTLETWLVQAKAYVGSILGVGLLSPLLYLMAMGVGLGVVVDRASGGGLGVPYLHFVAPALLLSTAMQAATEENTFTIMGGFKWRETYYAPQVTPITPEQIAGGHVLGVTLRYLVTCIIYWVVLAVFGAIPHVVTGLLLIPIGVLCASSVGLPIMAWSSTITQDKGQFALLGRFVIMPMMLFAGTYFPLETLPIYLQPIGWVSPLWHAVVLGRAVTIGTPVPAGMVVVHVGYMVALCLVGWFLARRHYRRRLVG
ncbi:ABC transporter permease [Tessaracoccus antarcticus]|uniref:Transport permease protein n=1 Tax=Tessaracoccus antarcticus TaxID=2479848 RepID=A0A3M0GAT1_9ACTN|nr:ABC transporter permease [Tessaracoccus antarcticus]RMB61407.1 ABC transporter permease [Tessaracoccus antarcticus]